MVTKTVSGMRRRKRNRRTLPCDNIVDEFRCHAQRPEVMMLEGFLPPSNLQPASSARYAKVRKEEHASNIEGVTAVYLCIIEKILMLALELQRFIYGTML